MDIAEYIEQVRKNQGRTKTWVAEQININYKTFVDRVTHNRFTADDLIKISKVLNIDLEKMKGEIDNEN